MKDAILGVLFAILFMLESCPNDLWDNMNGEKND